MIFLSKPGIMWYEAVNLLRKWSLGRFMCFNAPEDLITITRMILQVEEKLNEYK